MIQLADLQVDDVSVVSGELNNGPINGPINEPLNECEMTFSVHSYE